MASKNTTFKVGPSQWINIHWLLIALASVATLHLVMIIPILLYLYKLFDVKVWTYHFTEDSIIETRGPFSLTHEEVHYFRIKDIRLEEPLLMRLVGLSNIYIISSDQLRPVLKLTAVYEGFKKRNILKKQTLITRKEMGIKEYDIR